MSKPYLKPLYLVIVDNQVLLQTEEFVEAVKLHNKTDLAIIASAMVGPSHVPRPLEMQLCNQR